MDFRGEPKPTNPAMPAIPATQGQQRIPVLTMIVGEMPGRMFRVDEAEMVIGRVPECDVQLTDAGVSRMHAQLEQNAFGVEVVDLGSTNGTFVNGDRVERCTLRDGDKVQLGSTVVLRFNLQDALDEAFQRQQFEQMTRDPLTGCHNRLYFDEELRREVAFSRRMDASLCLLVVDVDLFKVVNDTHGHSVGDDVLRQLGQVLYGQLRGYDVLARYGGEEFVALLRGASLDHATTVAERLRLAVKAHDFGPPDPSDADSSLSVTVSIGIAAVEEVPDGEADDLFRLADNRLYTAKGTGRDRVCWGGPEPVSALTQPVDIEATRLAIQERRNHGRALASTQSAAPMTLADLNLPDQVPER